MFYHLPHREDNMNRLENDKKTILKLLSQVTDAELLESIIKILVIFIDQK